MKLSTKGKFYATKCHVATKHKYDGQSYEIHLKMVQDVGNDYIGLLPPDEMERERVFAAIWAHDLIEDCRQTYNDVKEVLGRSVADIVFACTNEKGKTRKDRANDKFYSELNQIPFANFVKICDRIANMRYSLAKRSSMALMYVKENEYFQNRMWCHAYSKMFDEMNNLVMAIQEIIPASSPNQ